MASEHNSLEPALHEMTPGTISSGFVPNTPPSTPYVPLSRTDWDVLFQPLFDELLNPPPSIDPPAPEVIAPNAEVVAPGPAESNGSPSSKTVDQDAPSPKENHDLDVAHMNNDPFFGIPILENDSESSSSDVIPTIVYLNIHCICCSHEYDRLPNGCEDGIMRVEVYVSQPNGFVDQDNPNHVYKLKKALYGLKQAPRTCPRCILLNQSKYALESLKKYGMISDTVDTLMVEKSKLDEDPLGKAVDPTHYRGMVDTLMYLTASRPDLTFTTWDIAGFAKILDEVHLEVCNYWETDLLAGHQKVLWMRSHLTDYGLGFNKIPIFQSFIKEQVENGVVELYFVNTEYQLAGHLHLKSLAREERIEFLINKLECEVLRPETLKQ
ncbi:putative reverse transcriptase domain-containing protein [Tanacetum coccineum]